MTAAGCSSPPPVEEVIPDGEQPLDDSWCQVLSSGEVQALLGEGDIERVRQSGGYRPAMDRSVARCSVVWADGDHPVVLVNSMIERLRGGQLYVESLTDLRDMLGTRGQRLDAGDVVELQPGTYLHIPEPDRRGAVERGSVRVFLGCDTGERQPALLGASADIRVAEAGRNLTQEQFAALGERLVATTTQVYPCDGELRSLGPEDWEPLTELALEN